MITQNGREPILKKAKFEMHLKDLIEKATHLRDKVAQGNPDYYVASHTLSNLVVTLTLAKNTFMNTGDLDQLKETCQNACKNAKPHLIHYKDLDQRTTDFGIRAMASLGTVCFANLMFWIQDFDCPTAQTDAVRKLDRFVEAIKKIPAEHEEQHDEALRGGPG